MQLDVEESIRFYRPRSRNVGLPSQVFSPHTYQRRGRHFYMNPSHIESLLAEALMHDFAIVNEDKDSLLEVMLLESKHDIPRVFVTNSENVVVNVLSRSTFMDALANSLGPIKQLQLQPISVRSSFAMVLT